MTRPRRHEIDRRDFLHLVPRGAAGLALAGLSLASRVAAREPEPELDNYVRSYRVLGRTGLEISDVSFGASRLRGDVSLVHDALGRGVNYFDTAESYAKGRSEETLGRALEGRREGVVLASKVKCQGDTRASELMRALEQSLRRLRTDRVELYFNHAVNDVARLQNPEWQEFTTRAKEQGKIRFTGMSGHGAQLAECLDYALENDLIDVMLVAHNFGQDPAFYQRLLGTMDFIAIQPELPRVLARAHEEGVGVIAMKTLMGARLNDMRPYESGESTFAQAAFRWVLSGPHVDALIVSMTSREKIVEYLGASGAQRVSRSDLRLLGRYARRFAPTQCQHGCGACSDACPQRVPIAEVLRTRMYARDYEDLELAREEYAQLGEGASACLACAEMACLGRCPVGLEIAPLTRDTHRLLGAS